TQTATVKVGLDTTLGVSFAHPGVADFGSAVEVKVAKSQPGATYQLVYAGADGAPVTTAPVPGTGADISLFTKPVQEDTQIRVQATRTFSASEGRPSISEPLDTTLALAVRANPALAVSIYGSPLVDPLQGVTLTIAGSQKNVTYSAFVRTLLDAD